MEYRLSLLILVLGSLGFSLSILVVACVVDSIRSLLCRGRRPGCGHEPSLRSEWPAARNASGKVPEVINERSGVA
jgi:hypothetical protein